ncbi:MAG TPA: hypothetical protein VGH28_11130 [Polyangiaceae bacterium]|jgi:hypothetical protein
MRVRLFVGLAAVATTAVGALFACGQTAVGSDACQQIEHARCYWIEQCYADAANYGLPTRRSESSSPVDDCFRYYDDACQHGLVTPVQPTSDQVAACVTAIGNATDCTIVQAPETADACAFLTAEGGVDAGDAD